MPPTAQRGTIAAPAAPSALAGYAMQIYCLAAALPLIAAELRLTHGQTVAHAAALAAGCLLTGLALPQIVPRLAHRASSVGTVATCAALVLVACADTAALTLAGYTLASAAALLSLSPAVTAHPTDRAALIHTTAHALLAIGLAWALFGWLAALHGWRVALLLPVTRAALIALTTTTLRPSRRPV